MGPCLLSLLSGREAHSARRSVSLLGSTLVWKFPDSTPLAGPEQASEELALSWARRGLGRPGFHQRTCVWTEHSAASELLLSWLFLNLASSVSDGWKAGKGFGTPSSLALSCHARSFSSLTLVFRKPARVGKAAGYLPPGEKQTFACTHRPWLSPAHLFCQLPCPLPVRLFRMSCASGSQN